ncbi:EscV/YscV/HrcV family type III secretion system export apparatus protein [Oxalobacteraceae bacterium CAVE-383]|nr:EscV/YscV/HrcV family type III secretion system export apparatus protein [Oxalobacteraceae bacterium CAVE-383]
MSAFMISLKKWSMAAAPKPDIALIAALVAVLAMMVLPMPTALLDILIGINLSFALVLLIVALHLASPLQISSFPAILLVTTLFRLGLSISTTRQILLQGNAGHVVQTFGMFVVGGNIIVGLIVFLILTLVQFMVITKGSERVAEVSARFSLDGMPGKQMAIDGDLRANSIDKDEAKERRVHIELENQFYGSMDGAMKFVKGDAIAGLIIVVVNLLGGMGVAILQQGMDFSTAMHTYSILTVGDGLVSQIPALLISISSGVIVTRVANRDTNSTVARDIARQLMGNPKGILVSGLAMGGIAFLPGMPASTFLSIAVLLTALGITLFARQRTAADKAPSRHDAGIAAGGGAASEEQSFSVPLMISLSSDLVKRYGLSALEAAIENAQKEKGYEMGVPFPKPVVRVDAGQLDADCTVHCNEVPVARWKMPVDTILLQRIDADRVNAIGGAGNAVDFGRDFPLSYWAAPACADQARGLGAAVFSDLGIFTLHLNTVLARHASEFIGLHEVCALFNALEKSCPDLVKEIDRLSPRPRIADVLQRLVFEGLPIRNLKGIVETLTRWSSKEKDAVVLTEYVRADMKRQITYKYTQGRNILHAYLISPGLEETMRSSVRQTSAGSYIVLDPRQTDLLLDAIHHVVGGSPPSDAVPVILAAMDVRRYMRKLIERDYPELAVIAYQELQPNVQIQSLGEIDVNLSGSM